ncbi:MAG: hypothetical protein V1697_02905 [Candidatus Levyibacteriota bacterium]
MDNKIANIEKLAILDKKVFTTDDLAIIWQIPERRRLIERIKYYLRKKRLTHIHKGVYAYGKDYSPLDIAQKLVSLSYISLYTTTQMHGLTFQFYSSIFCVSLESKKYQKGEQKYIYHRVKEMVFYNQTGLIDNGRYIIADKERTICDCLYVFPGFSFDNLLGVDKEKLLKLSSFYKNKRLEKDIKKLVSLIE